MQELNYNFHAHTHRCHHASGTEEEYVINAVKGGIKKMGFSEHFPLKYPDGYEASFRLRVDEVPLYRATVMGLREKYKNDIKLFMGFEMEYFPQMFSQMLSSAKAYGAEYLILGQHFHGPEHFGGGSVMQAFDDEDKLVKYIDNMIEAIGTGAFTYVAHPDIINYIGDKSVYRRELARFCDAAKRLSVPLEINFLGIRDNRNYPNEIFWQIAGETGVSAVYGFDAHDPVAACDKASLLRAEALAKKYGVNVTEPELIAL